MLQKVIEIFIVFECQVDCICCFRILTKMYQMWLVLILEFQTKSANFD